MPHVEKHAPGTFSWIELGTTDQAAAKRFYGSLFGWESLDHPMGPDGIYTMFKLEGRDAAGCFALKPGEPIPPHWGLYTAVENADDAVKRTTELGGDVLEPAFDVFTLGRMAVLKDPTGAVFHVWQAKTHIGTGITGVDGTLCWADLNTPDPQRAKIFYEQLLGWRMVTGKDKSADSYQHIMSGESGIGGIPPVSEHNQNMPPHWMIYFLVSDCDAATAKAKDLGATVYMAPMSPEPSLRFSVLADPQGAVFALFTPKH